jgi:methyl-accepting chemotaxis protein
VRTLSWISRVFAAGAAVAALALIVGGSYYVGFVGEVQRGLNDPQSASRQAADKISSIEQTLGYQGYLRSYRSFRLTGDITARQQLTQRAMEASRALDGLKNLFAGSPDAKLAIGDIEAVVEEFARVARSAPETASAALRGSASMDAIDTMPQVPQLESTYLTLRSGLDRLRAQARSYQMGSVAWALSWSQMLIICAFAAIVCGLLAAASLLQIGITQPLKSLAQSLQVAGEGRLGLPIWGTDRSDEIGEMARAGEKLRKSLTETDALQELARKAQLNIRIEGEASALLGRTMSVVVADVQQATDALKQAAADLQETQAFQRQSLEAQTASIGGVGTRLENLVTDFGAGALRVFDKAATDLGSASSSIIRVAETSETQLAAVASQLENRGKQASDAFDHVRTRTGSLIDSLSGSITAFSKAADSTQTIQTAFYAACDRISSDASSTADNVRALAARLENVIATAEAQAQQPAPAAPAERDDEAEGIEAIVRLFKSDEILDATTANASLGDMLAERIVTALRDRLTPDEALHRQVEVLRNDIRELALRMTQERTPATAEAPATETPTLAGHPQQALTDAAVAEILERLRRLSDEMTVSPSDAEAILRLFKSDENLDGTTANASPGDVLAERIVNALRDRLAPDETLHRQVGVLRNDIRELALRMTEERILMTAEMPAPALAAEAPALTGSPQRTLADVPAAEIFERLRRLSDEMAASPSGASEMTDRGNDNHEQDETAPSLTENLKAFALSVKPLGGDTDQPAELRDMAHEFERYAEAIELSAQEVAHAAALRAELDAITTELRTLAATLQASPDAKPANLQETALDLGARAETLFTYLNQRQARGHNNLQAEAPAQATSPAAETGTFSRATQDLLTLARIITSLEERTAMLSDAAVAANISSQTQHAAGPGTDSADAPPAHETETAIAVVYDAVERLNNIAAALARASDAGRLREAATA